MPCDSIRALLSIITGLSLTELELEYIRSRVQPLWVLSRRVAKSKANLDANIWRVGTKLPVQ
jgi:hypothetical protein